jgi:hypothetical protein
MVQGLLWHLTSDSVLTTGTKEAQKDFPAFIACGETSITAGSYYGAVIILGCLCLCPSAVYHSAVMTCLPTHINHWQKLSFLPWSQKVLLTMNH